MHEEVQRCEKSGVLEKISAVQPGFPQGQQGGPQNAARGGRFRNF